MVLTLSYRNRVSRTTIFYTFHSLFLLASIALFATGVLFDDCTLALVGVFCLYGANVWYGFLNLKDRLLFLFLHAGIALFWLSRPAVALFDSTRTWMASTPQTTAFVLWSIFLTLIFLFLGTAFYSGLSSYNERMCHQKDFKFHRVISRDNKSLSYARRQGSLFCRPNVLKNVRAAAFMCFLVCVVGSFAVGFIKLSYMQGLRYEDYYLIAASDYVPWLLGVMDVAMPYLLCAFLATLPRRGTTVVCFLLYIFSTIPLLIIGSRADFVMAFFLAALYFVFRNVTDKEQKWIGKKEILFVLIAAPIGVFFMGLWNYLRAGQMGQVDGFFAQIIDAFYKQGVTFSVLGYAYDVAPQVESLGSKFYSFGFLVENFTQGFIGQTFFDFPTLPSGNSVELALQGNSYAHTMSYFAHWNYLGGAGYGSSYILELFTDFGYVGIIIGSFFIGFIFVALSRSIGKTWAGGMISLIAALAIFHMPRGSAMEWISFILTTRFWMAMIGLACVTGFVSLVFDRFHIMPVMYDFLSGSKGYILQHKIKLGHTTTYNKDASLQLRIAPRKRQIQRLL